MRSSVLPVSMAMVRQNLSKRLQTRKVKSGDVTIKGEFIIHKTTRFDY